MNFAEEHIEYNYPGNDCRIYTDSCMTDLIQLGNESNIYNLDDDLYNIKPRFNKGIWSLNYFRDIKNNNVDRNKESENCVVELKYHTEDSLVYGKYFVTRFIFMNSNFKFENITFNANIYE
jgi:hypothetical protein